MQRIMICTSVLGAGTVLVFVAAALVAMLFPNGTMVAAGWNGGWAKDGWAGDVAMPAPMVVPVEGGGWVQGTDRVFESVPEK